MDAGPEGLVAIQRYKINQKREYNGKLINGAICPKIFGIKKKVNGSKKPFS